jgi:hypothetical protein
MAGIHESDDITPTTATQPGPWHQHPHRHGYTEHQAEGVPEDHWHRHDETVSHHDLRQHLHDPAADDPAAGPDRDHDPDPT